MSTTQASPKQSTLRVLGKCIDLQVTSKSGVGCFFAGTLSGGSDRDRFSLTYYILAIHGRMTRKITVCVTCKIKAYATPASKALQVRPSLSKAVPEFDDKTSPAEGASSARGVDEFIALRASTGFARS